MPITGPRASSRAACRPGSPKHAITQASALAASPARTCSATPAAAHTSSWWPSIEGAPKLGCTALKKIIPTGNLLGIDTKRIKNADKITSLFTKGEVGGKKVGDQGTAPKKVMYLEKPDSKTFSATPTQFMTLIPTVYNADTLGIRPT